MSTRASFEFPGSLPLEAILPTGAAISQVIERKMDGVNITESVYTLWTQTLTIDSQ